MSDTDDTDVLLLIPPDFFLINSDTDSSIDGNWSEHCRFHCDLVENLAGEVGVLKNRVNCIENLSITSSICSTDRMTESEMSHRNYQFTEDFRNRYMTNSTNSTPQKPKTKLVVNSLPSTPSTERENFRRSKRASVNFERKIQDSRSIQPIKSRSQHSIPIYNDNDADISSYTSSPDKRDNKEVLGEIDQFLSHVKTIKRYVTSKNLENEYPPADRDHQSLPISFDNSPLKLSDLKGEGDFKYDKKKRLDLRDVDQLIQSLEEQQQKMEKVPITNRIVEGNETQTHTWKPGENKNSVPDYNFGFRNIMYAKEDAEKLANNIEEYLNNQCNPQMSNIDLDVGDSDTTNETTPPTVFENPIESYMLKKPQNELIRNPPDYLPTKKVNVFDYVTKSLPQNNGGKTKVTEEVVKKVVQSNVHAEPIRNKRNLNNESKLPNPNMFGLPDLWKKGITYPQAGDQMCIAKLEEEKMRRQHCEKLIQELQLKHLEMQQRLAVAVQVDCAKDAAILKFHKAWEKVSDRWTILEAERNQLSQKLNGLKGKSDQDLSEAKKKLLQYETEMSKALDLAHANQEKVNNLEFEKNSLIVELETIKKDVEIMKNKVISAEKERDDLRTTLINFETENQQDKNLVTNLQKELNIQKQKCQNDLICFQKEIKLLSEEKEKLEKEVTNTNGLYNVLESKNKSMENLVEICKKNEVSSPDVIYINTGKTEHNFDCMICFLE